MKRNIRDCEIPDVDLIINYFLQADHTFLKGMGIEPSKLPHINEWRQILFDDFEPPIDHKKFYYIIWEVDNVPVGHSNINKIIYGQEAYMHLHLWQPEKRKNGNGTFFIQESISCYFEKFDLQTLFCEPYALNPAPNRTLPKIGFDLIKTYETIPGWICFNQPVNRWGLTKEKWLQNAEMTGLTRQTKDIQEK